MRDIPENNLAYPILINTNIWSSGSWFLINNDWKIFLATAKHVLFSPEWALKWDQIKVTCPSNDINDDTTTIFTINMDSENVLKHSITDVACIKLWELNEEEWWMNLVKWMKIIQEGKTWIVFVSTESIKKLNEVLVSNEVFVYGYPSSLGIKNSPQFDYNQPLLRKWIVANIYKNYWTIILDCPVYFWNSWWPVIEVEKDGANTYHRVIWVVSEFIPFVEEWHNKNTQRIERSEYRNSGYSVAVSMDSVLSLINAK